MTETTFTPVYQNNSNNNNNVCGGLGCNSKPSKRMVIDCGEYGSLTIFVCEICSSKFKQGMKRTEKNTFNISNDESFGASAGHG